MYALINLCSWGGSKYASDVLPSADVMREREERRLTVHEERRPSSRRLKVDRERRHVHPGEVVVLEERGDAVDRAPQVRGLVGGGAVGDHVERVRRDVVYCASLTS